MNKIIQKGILLILAVALFSCSEFQKTLKSDDIDKKFDAAIAYYKDQDYYRAGLLLEELIPITRGTANAEISLFYYAYCHYYQNQLYLATFYFENLLSTYPRSEYAEEAQYMAAKSKYEGTPKYNLDQSSTQSTLADLQSFINKYPNSQYVRSSETMMENLNARIEQKAFESAVLYHKLGYYKSAVITLDHFKNDFPTSKFLEEATFIRLESQFKLAKLSVEDKKDERFREAITFYQDFVDTFPNSKFARQAENIYDLALNNINKND